MNARETIRQLVRIKYDYQDMRIRTSNRLALKKDDTAQDREAPDLPAVDIMELVDIKNLTKDLEAKIDKGIAKCLKGNPVYEGFLKGVKGVGPVMAGVLLSEIDLEKATTVSKIWQYAGLNPSMVRGRKKVVGMMMLTDTMVRGDRKTAGFAIPYNPFLKTKLLGVLADSFIKHKSPYTEHYYNMKSRLEQSSKEFKEGRKWSEESKAHRDLAARRYMIKMFLADYYSCGRAILGLEVRPPYQEEYLGHKHNGGADAYAYGEA